MIKKLDKDRLKASLKYAVHVGFVTGFFIAWIVLPLGLISYAESKFLTVIIGIVWSFISIVIVAYWIDMRDMEI